MSHPPSAATTHPTTTPHATTLRVRAAGLRQLASRVESLTVMTLLDADDEPTLHAPVAEAAIATRLGEALLAHNLLQLHAAADELRAVAFRCCTRADDLDAARRSAA